MTKAGQAIYVSIEVWRAMMRIARDQMPGIDIQRARVADEIADALLREVIQQKYPQLLELS